MKIKVRKLNDSAIIPTQATTGSAGFDLYATETHVIWKGDTRLVPTGIALAIPQGYEGQVRSRSGLASRGVVVANSPGTIDSDYHSELGVLIHNQSKHSITISKGDRVAQLVINKIPVVEFVEVDELVCTGRGGFGSTGR